MDLACGEHPILITYPQQMSNMVKEALVQTLMLSFDACAVSLIKRSHCLVKQLQLGTCLLLNFESDMVEVIPHYEDWPMENLIQTSKRWNEKHVLDLICKESPELKRFKKVLHPELFEQILSAACFENSNETSSEIVLPNHKSLYISSETKEDCKKVVFPKNWKQNELVLMVRRIMESMQSICEETSNQMIQNIVVSVSGSSFEVKQLAERVERQIKMLYPLARCVAAVYGAKEAFAGACNIANSKTFASICTLPNYFEYYGTSSVKFMYF